MFVCHHIAQIENQRLMYNNWVVLGDALIVKPKSSIRLLCANMLFVICFPLIGNNGTPLLPQNVNTIIKADASQTCHGRRNRDGRER